MVDLAITTTRWGQKDGIEYQVLMGTIPPWTCHLLLL